MRVAIVGATGNVGWRLTAALAAEEAVEQVVAVARREPSELPAGVEWREADLGAPLPDDLLRGVDCVVHLAWLFQPSHDPETTWRANAAGTARLLEAVEAAGVGAVVHASSVGAYSPRVDERPVDESWPTHGIGAAAYSVEKAYAERLLDRFELRHPEVRVVRMRPAFIFREESAVQQRRLFAGPLAPTKLLARTGVPVLPDPGGLVFQALHTDDVVEAYRLAVVGEARGPFNVAAEPVLGVGDLAELLGARVVRVPAGAAKVALRTLWGTHLVPASPGMFEMALQIPMLDSGRARRELGWAPRYDGREALAALVEGMRKGAGEATPPLDPDTSGPFRSQEFGTGSGSRP